MPSLTELNDYTNAEYEAYLNSLDERDMTKIMMVACECYYGTGKNGLTDERYDMLIERIPQHVKIGAKVSEEMNRVTLPYHMGSLNKIKVNQVSELERWVARNKCEEYVVENKIDGVSCLLISRNGELFLYTRGDGKVGVNISHLARRIVTIPKIKENIVVRGELVMKRKVFSEKFAGEFANPRNMVSGIVGKKEFDKNVEWVNFVAYEIIGEKLSPEEQLLKLKGMKFEVVQYCTLPFLKNEELEKLLKKRREKFDYDMDGLVIQSNKVYERNTSGNPSYAFAFKGESEVAVVRVLDVEWNISKHGLIKPRLRIEPVNLGGVCISYATGFNGFFIRDHDIGEGAIIELTRSGDVIPHITRVVKGTVAKMPDFEYVWNDSCVDIMCAGETAEQHVKLLTSFFAGMDIKFMGQKTVEKLFEAELNTIEKIVEAEVKDFMKVEGIQAKSAERIFTNIRNGLRKASMSKVLGASGVFGIGFGERKITALLSAIPNLLERENDEKLRKDIEKVEGFSSLSACKILESLNKAKELVKSLQRYMEVNEKTKGRENDTLETETKFEVKSNLNNMNIVFTGFRDKELEKEIVKCGGRVLTSVSSKTTHLVVKDKDGMSEKILKAKKQGVEICTVDEFKAKISV